MTKNIHKIHKRTADETVKFYNTRKFNKLKKEWYGKLKEEGFEDIEFSEDSWYIKDDRYRTSKAVERSNTNGDGEFFRVATIFLWEHEFEREYDRFVWEQYSNGIMQEEIVRILANNPDPKWRTSRYPVSQSIIKTKRLMIQWVKECDHERQTND